MEVSCKRGGHQTNSIVQLIYTLTETTNFGHPVFITVGTVSVCRAGAGCCFKHWPDQQPWALKLKTHVLSCWLIVLKRIKHKKYTHVPSQISSAWFWSQSLQQCLLQRSARRDRLLYKWMDRQTNIATVYFIIWTRCNRQTVRIIMWFII